MSVTRRRDIITICAITLLALIAPFASDSYSPSLPAITKAFGSSANIMQLTMSVYLLGAALAQLFYGPWSDKIGRRGVILLGVAICFIGSILCVVATSPWFLIAARFVQGAGAGAANALFRAVMRDAFTSERLAKILSYTSVAYTITAAAAPIFGGYIEAWFGWRVNFMVAAGFILFVFLVIWRFLPETNQKLDEHALLPARILKNYWIVLSNNQFVFAALLSSFAYSGFMCFYAAAPFLMQNIVGLSAVQFGWLSIFLAGGSMIGALVNGRVVNQYGVMRMLGIGVGVMFVSSLIMLIISFFGVLNTFVVIGPVFCFSVASGLVFANAMVKAFQAFSTMAGAAGAMYGCMQMLIAVIMSAALARLHLTSQLPLAGVYSFLGILGAVFFWRLAQIERGK